MVDLNPHSPCAVCEVTRENHGDMNHRFSTDGQLVPMRPGTPPRQQPPQLKGESSTPTLAQTQQMVLRLIDVLTRKGMLEAPELIFIFGGELGVSSTGGPPAGRADEADTTQAAD